MSTIYPTSMPICEATYENGAIHVTAWNSLFQPIRKPIRKIESITMKNRLRRGGAEETAIETAITLELSLAFSVSSITLVGPLGGV